MALPSIEQAKQLALEFCRPPRFGQFITLNRAGALRGRTLGAALKPDWTVEIASFRQFARARQVRNNPNAMVLWTDGAVAQRGPGGREEGATVPKAVFASGQAEVLSGPDFLSWYEQRLAAQGPIRGWSPEEAEKNMEMIVFRVHQLRMEGFAAPDTELSFAEVTSGLTFDPRES